jgi:hypothetical protein
VAVPVQVAAPVQTAAPAMDYPYPAPAAQYAYPADEPVVPLWQPPKSSRKTVYLYVGGAVVLFLMVLIVLNTINFLSLPFIGSRPPSSPPSAALPSPSPGPTTRSEYTRGDVFLNGSFTPALMALGQIDPQMQSCSSEFTTSCFNAITVTDPPLKQVLAVIDKGSIPPCIAQAMAKFRTDLAYMEGGLQTALKGYKDTNRNELIDGVYRFTHFGALQNEDLDAANYALKTRCSMEQEGP